MGASTSRDKEMNDGRRRRRRRRRRSV